MKYWSFVGRWIEPPLMCSFWVNIQKYDGSFLNELIIPFSSVPSGWYVNESDEKKVKKFIDKIDSNFIVKLINKSEYMINQAFNFQGSLIDLFEFIPEYIHVWNTYTQLSHFGFENSLLTNKQTLLDEERNEIKRIFLNKDSLDLDKEIKNHLKKFSFLGTNVFHGTPQDKESLLERINSFKLSDEEKEERNYLAVQRMRLAETFSYLTYKYWPILKELGLKYDLELDDLIYCTYLEIIDLIKGKEIDKSEILLRKNKWGLWIKNNNLVFMKSDEIDYFEKQHLISSDLKEFKAITAYRGFVKGKIKIISKIDDYKNFKKGNILVAFETTPEFMPIIHKASAIITEVGGMLSHAAIVSREFKIPCVVALKNATKIFKDGDIVEVDANTKNGTSNGVVRKIE